MITLAEYNDLLKEKARLKRIMAECMVKKQLKQLPTLTDKLKKVKRMIEEYKEENR